jgi:hypothetical protein
MTEIKAIVTGPEEAYNNEAEFWCANELMAVTVLREGRLHLRIDPRADGSPWLADVASLARPGRGRATARGLLRRRDDGVGLT